MTDRPVDVDVIVLIIKMMPGLSSVQYQAVRHELPTKSYVTSKSEWRDPERHKRAKIQSK